MKACQRFGDSTVFSFREGTGLTCAFLISLALIIMLVGGCRSSSSKKARETADLIEKLNSPDPVVRAKAATALHDVSLNGAEAIPSLGKLLSDNDVTVRRAAALTLYYWGAAAAPVKPALVHALADTDDDVRWCAASSLGKVGGLSKADVLALSERLTDPERSVRISAAEAIGTAGDEATAAIPFIRQALKDKDDSVRSHVALAAGAMGASAAPLRNDLAGLLEKHDPAQGCAADALGLMGPAAGDTAPSLQRALRDESASVRASAARALWKVSGNTKDTVPVLIGCLSSTQFHALPYQHGKGGFEPDDVTRYQAAKTLGEMGPVAAPAKEALQKALQDAGSLYGEVFEEALRQIEPSATTQPKK